MVQLKAPERTAFGIVVAVTIVILLAMTVYLLAFSTVKVSGVVDHKTIVGIRDGTQYTLVVMLPWGINVKDRALDSLFQGQDSNFTVNATVEQEMLGNGYSEIKYLTSIQVSSKDSVNHIDPGGALAYFVKRSDFNSLKFGTSVTYEVEKGETATIARVNA